MADVWTDKLSDFLDGELSEADAGSLESHLTSCVECAATLDQLRAVTFRASGLQDLGPETDLWEGISASIKERAADRGDVVDIRQAAKARRKISFSVPQLLAAGITLMSVSAGSVWLAFSGTEEVGVPIVAETALQGESAVVFASFHEPGYDAAVAELERLLEAGRDRLDPTTVTVLERSLATIDQAISEARAALETDPTNHYLSEHLSETMNQKVRLLRQAARLATAAS